MKATFRKMLPVMLAVCIIAVISVFAVVSAGAKSYTSSDYDSATVLPAGIQMLNGGQSYKITGSEAVTRTVGITSGNVILYLDGTVSSTQNYFTIESGATLEIRLIGISSVSNWSFQGQGTLKIDGAGQLTVSSPDTTIPVVLNGKGEYIQLDGTVAFLHTSGADTAANSWAINATNVRLEGGSLTAQGDTAYSDGKGLNFTEAYFATESIWNTAKSSINGTLQADVAPTTYKIMNGTWDGVTSLDRKIYSTDGYSYSVAIQTTTDYEAGFVTIGDGSKAAMTSATSYDYSSAAWNKTVYIDFAKKVWLFAGNETITYGDAFDSSKLSALQTNDKAATALLPLKYKAVDASSNEYAAGDKATTYTVKVWDSVSVRHSKGEYCYKYYFDKNASFADTYGVLTVNKKSITLKSNDASKVYDGTPLTKAGGSVTVGSLYDNDTVTYNTTGSATNYPGVANTFTYTIKRKGTGADVSGNYAVSKDVGMLTINERTIKIQTKTESWTYDGTAHSTDASAAGAWTLIDSTTLVEGHKLTVTFSKSVTNVSDGQVDNEISSWTVKDAGSNDVSSNYQMPSYTKGKISINPLSVTVTAEAKSITYGDAAPSYTYIMEPATIPDAITVKFTSFYTAGNKADSYSIFANYNGFYGNTNYNATVTGNTLTVGIREIHLKTTDVSWTYDMTAHSTTDAQVTVVSGSWYTGDTPSYSGVVTLTHVSEGEKTITYAVTEVKRGAQDLIASYNIVWDSYGKAKVTPAELKYTVNDVTSLPYGDMPTNNGILYTSGALADISADIGVINAKINCYYDYSKGNNVGTYHIFGNVKTAQKYIDTNYHKDYTVVAVPGTLTVVKRQITLAPASQTITYGEMPSATFAPIAYSKFIIKNLYGTDSPLSIGLDVSSVVFSYSYVAGNGFGSYTITLSDISGIPEMTNYYPEFEYVDPTAMIPTKVTNTLTVNKLAITIKSADNEKIYDGTPLTKNSASVTVGKIVTDFGDALEYSLNGSQTYVGFSENTFESYDIKRSGTSVMSNYVVTIVKGTLTVNKRDITIKANSSVKTYDGTALTNSGYTVPSGSIAAGDTATVTIVGTAKFYTATPVTNEVTNVVIKNAALDDVTYCYNITEIDGTLTINKLAVTATAPTSSFIYDGTEHTDNLVTFNIAVPGTDTFTFTMTDTSKVKYVTDGAISNVILSISVKNTVEGDATDSYDFTEIDGTLTVTKRKIVALDGYVVSDKDYDGTTDATFTPTSNNVAYYTDSSVVDSVAAADIAASGISITYVADFDNKNAGTNKDVTIIPTVSGTLADNYQFDTFYSKADIDKVDLTVTANNHTITYENSVTTNGYVITGFITGEDEAGLRLISELSGTPSLTPSYTQWQNISEGPFSITPALNTLTATNYNFVTFTPGTLTVEKADMTVVLTPVNVEFDHYYHSIGVVVNNPISLPASFNLVNSYSEDNTVWQASNFQFHDAMAEKTIYVKIEDTVGNYNTYTGSTTIEITKAPLTVQAKTFNIAYGDAAPAWDVTAIDLIGLKGPDTFMDLVGTLKLTCDYLPGENADVKAYTIVPSGYSSINYDITFVNGVLNINKTDLYVYVGTPNDPVAPTASTIDLIYGDTLDIDTMLTWVGFIDDEDVSVLTGSLTATVTYNPYTYEGVTSVGFSKVGSYGVTFGGVSSDNYAIHFVPATVTVSQKQIRVTADELTKVYGETDPEFTYVSDYPLVGTDAFSGIIAREPGENVGKYKLLKGTLFIVNEDGEDIGCNYTIYFVDGQMFEITKKTLKVTADDKSVTYGNTAAVPFTASYEGFEFGDNETVLTGVLDFDCEYDPAVAANRNVGTYTITPKGYDVDNGNYTVEFADGTLTVNKASLTIEVGTFSMVYGTPDWKVYAHIESTTGLVYSEDLYDVIDITSPYVTPDYLGAASNVRNDYYYVIKPIQISENYDITVQGAFFSVTKKDVTITVEDKNIIYGDVAPEYTATTSALAWDHTIAYFGLNFTCSYAQGDDATTYVIDANATTGTNNYNVTIVPGTLTVGTKSITVSVDPKTIIYGDQAPAFTVTCDGLYSGDTVEDLNLLYSCDYDDTISAKRNVGSYPISVIASNSNYSFTYVHSTLTVNKAALEVKANNIDVIYGDSPVFDIVYDGFKYGETKLDLGGSLMIDCGTYAKETAQAGQFFSISLSGYTSDNYEISYVGGTLEVKKAALTITVQPQTIKYGDALNAFESVFSGWKNGETEFTFDLIPAYACDYQIGMGVGTYEASVTVDLTKLGNYDVTTIAGVVTVDAATLTVKFVPKTIIYGDAVPTFTLEDDILSITGFKNGETFYEANITGAIVTDYVQGDGVGTYAIKEDVSHPFTADNYTFNFDLTSKVTVNAKTVTITIDAKNITYGDIAPDYTATVEGLYGTDTFADLNSTLSCTYVQGDGANVYDIVLTVDGPSNYTFTAPANGVLTVAKKSLNLGVVDCTTIYGDAAPAFTFAATGYVLGEDATYLDVVGIEYTTAYDTTDPENRGAGEYDVTVSGITSDNYEIIFEKGTLTVTKREIKLRTSHSDIVYGDSIPTTESYLVEFKLGTSLVYGETFADINLLINTITCSDMTDYIPGTDVGNIMGIAKIDSENYNLVKCFAAVYNVVPKDLTITADDKNIVYGDAAPEYTVSYDGFVLGQDESVLGGTLAFACDYDTEDPANRVVDVYDIVASGLTSTNYNIIFVDGVLTVAPKTIDITFDGKTIIYGDPIPDYTYTVSGFQYGESLAGFGKMVTIKCDYTVGSGVGEYVISENADITMPNYSVNFVDGTLKVEKAELVVSYDNYEIIYGEAVPEYSVLAITGFKNGETKSGLILIGKFTDGSLVCDYVQNGDAGVYEINLDGFDADNYYFVSEFDRTLTVYPKDITITATTGLNKVYGSTDPNLTYTTDVTPVADDVFTLVREAGENVGTYAITVVDDPNYNITYIGTTFEITRKDLVIIPDGQTKIYGDVDPELTYEAIGFEFSDDESIITGALAREAGENAGTYAILVGNISAGNNYNIVFEGEDVNLEIEKAELVISADNKSIVYGDDAPEYTYDAVGFKFNDSIASLTGTLTLTSTYAKFSNAGSYYIVVSGVSSDNYYIFTEDGVLSVAKASATIDIVAANTSALENDIQVRKAIVLGTFKGVAGDTSSAAVKLVINGNVVDTLDYVNNVPNNKDLSDLTAQTYTVQLVFDGNTNYNAVSSSTVEFTVVDLDYTFAQGEINTVTGIATGTTKAEVETYLDAAIPGSSVEMTVSEGFAGTGYEIKVGTTNYLVFILADVNGDGVIDAKDIASIQKSILEIEVLDGVYAKAADVNGDASINSRDIAAIQRIVLA